MLEATNSQTNSAKEVAAKAVSIYETEISAKAQARFDTFEAEAALNRIKPLLSDASLENAPKIRVRTTRAVGLGVAYAQSFGEDRALFEKAFNPETFNVLDYDNLKDRALAFWYADIQLRQDSASLGPVQTLLATAREIRAKLLRAAVYLWENDDELGGVVANIRSGRSNANMADDLGGLAALFFENWDDVTGRCDITLDDLAQAEAMGVAVLKALSQSKDSLLDDLEVLRDMTGKFLRKGLEEVRSGANFVFQGDPEEMDRYPSLFIRKRNKKAKGDDESQSEDIDADADTVFDEEQTPQTDA